MYSYVIDVETLCDVVVFDSDFMSGLGSFIKNIKHKSFM